MLVKKNKIIDTYSYICEDFVMCCKVISTNSFVIGLKNGKLIKVLIKKNVHESNVKEKKSNNEAKYKISFDNYIKGHEGSVNFIEIYEKLGIIITGGEDKKVYIRKLYDFELLTSITFKSKFIISLARVSPNNFVYILCLI